MNNVPSGFAVFKVIHGEEEEYEFLNSFWYHENRLCSHCPWSLFHLYVSPVFLKVLCFHLSWKSSPRTNSTALIGVTKMLGNLGMGTDFGNDGLLESPRI